MLTCSLTIGEIGVAVLSLRIEIILDGLQHPGEPLATLLITVEAPG